MGCILWSSFSFPPWSVDAFPRSVDAFPRSVDANRHSNTSKSQIRRTDFSCFQRRGESKILYCMDESTTLPHAHEWSGFSCLNLSTFGLLKKSEQIPLLSARNESLNQSIIRTLWIYFSFWLGRMGCMVWSEQGMKQWRYFVCRRQEDVRTKKSNSISMVFIVGVSEWEVMNWSGLDYATAVVVVSMLLRLWWSQCYWGGGLCYGKSAKILAIVPKERLKLRR